MESRRSCRGWGVEEHVWGGEEEAGGCLRCWWAVEGLVGAG